VARIRTIKPEFFTSADILKLTPLARLFYVALWCEADREGRFKYDPETLKYRYLPADKVKVESLVAELTEAGLIRLYQIDGAKFGDIPSFARHQVINNREASSSFPPHVPDASLTRESGVSVEGRKGREGKEGTPPVAPKGAGYSEDFERFWEAYPEKIGKKAAWRAWEKAADRPDLPSILAAIKTYIATKPVDRNYAHPSTWINEGRWLDRPADHAPQGAAKPGENQWTVRVSGYRKTKFWMRDQWGPAPGEPDCRVPPELLSEAA